MHIGLLPVHMLATSLKLFRHLQLLITRGERELLISEYHLFTLQHRTKPSWQQTKPSFRLLSEPPSSSLPAPTTTQPTVTSAAPPPTLPTPATGILLRKDMCSQLKCHTFYLVLQQGAQSVPEVDPGILPPSLLAKLVQAAPLPSWADRGLALQRLQHSPSPARTGKSSGRPSLASSCEHCFNKGLMLYPERLA